MLIEPCFEKYSLDLSLNIKDPEFRSIKSTATQLRKNLKYSTLPVYTKVNYVYARMLKKAMSAGTPEQKKEAIKFIKEKEKYIEEYINESRSSRKYMISSGYDNIDLDALLNAVKHDTKLMIKILNK